MPRRRSVRCDQSAAGWTDSADSTSEAGLPAVDLPPRLAGSHAGKMLERLPDSRFQHQGLMLPRSVSGSKPTTFQASGRPRAGAVRAGSADAPRGRQRFSSGGRSSGKAACAGDDGDTGYPRRGLTISGSGSDRLRRRCEAQRMRTAERELMKRHESSGTGAADAD